MTSDDDYRQGSNVVSALHVHLVFVTRHRQGVFHGPMLSGCEAAMRKVCEEIGSELREFSGEPDHVHLLVLHTPKVAASALVNSLKGVSACRPWSECTGRVNRASTRGQLWSPSYFEASCGGARLGVVRQCSEQQRRPA
jgi:putative transposase